MSPRFDSLPLVLWNIAAIGLFLAAMADVLRQPISAWEKPRGKWLTLVLMGVVSLYIRGAYIPVLPVLWFVRRLRHQRAEAAASAAPAEL